MNHGIRKHKFVDIVQRKIYPAQIEFEAGKIVRIVEINADCEGYILPGFIDAHIHIESSMLVPTEFARLAVRFGTVGTISDPHEIANVCGLDGVKYMLENAAKTPFKFHFGAPSCVPATVFETAGAILGPLEVETLLARPDIYYLSEVMNYLGVLHGDPDMLAKIALAKKYAKPVDGHAPGLRGEAAKRYIDAGIQTDHECFTKEEALDKLKAGMKILIREGSAAKNFEALIDLLPEYYEQMMFCCDDKHPDELIVSHMDEHVRRAVARGLDLFQVLQVACINPVNHYNMRCGLLRPGDPADFIVVEDLTDFKVTETVLDGIPVYANDEVFLPRGTAQPVNVFYPVHLEKNALAFPVAEASSRIRCIEVLDGQLITQTVEMEAKIEGGYVVSDPVRDILKVVVVNRYKQAPPAVAFIRNFGLREGAIASTVAHDSHNIIAVGADDHALEKAIQNLITSRGGLSVVSSTKNLTMPLPVAGLMSLSSGDEVAAHYTELHLAAKALGCPLRSPFMSLSFMALLVIPQLKLSDLGLFDGNEFKFTDVIVK